MAYKGIYWRGTGTIPVFLIRTLDTGSVQANGATFVRRIGR